MRKCSCLAPQNFSWNNVDGGRFDFKSSFGQPLSWVGEEKQPRYHTMDFFFPDHSHPHILCFIEIRGGWGGGGRCEGGTEFT